MKLTNRERALWIQNDEPLYRWWQSTGKPLFTFIREERNGIDSYILRDRLGLPHRGENPRLK